MKRLPYILSIAIVITVFISCNRQPSYVIDQDDMAKLMADLYVAEGVVDQNYSQFNNDSTKLLLRQSVFAKHGVTTEQFDTSLVWYGHNMKQYLEVCDQVVKILESRERALGTAIVQNAISMSGDSVDIWSTSRYVKLNDRMPSRLVSFNVMADDNSEPGDVYVWRIKAIDNGVRSIRWNMFANYTDSTNEWLTSTTSHQGMNEMVFVTDSTKTLTGLKGYFELTFDEDKRQGSTNAANSSDFWIDSISLVRKRSNPELDMQRSRIHTYNDL